MIDSNKRKKMEKLIYDTFSALDKTGANTKRYKDAFSSMTDSQFDKFFKDLFNDEHAYLILNICDYEIDLRLDDIDDAAKVLDVPLFERVAFPHFTMDKDKVVVTSEKVPVGYAHEKRTQQILSKKNGLSTSVDTRSSLTGQVSGADKNGRESDLENSMLVSMGMTEVLKELNGPRADDLVMKKEMLDQINRNGYTELSTLTDKVENKTTLNTINTYFLGMGLHTDLVTKGLKLPYNIDKE